MTSILNKQFRYTSAADTAKPGYLREKFLAMDPKCFDKPQRAANDADAGKVWDGPEMKHGFGG